MSLKTLANKVGQGICTFFKNLLPFLQKTVAAGNELAQAIKDADTNNPGMVDFFTAIIPGHWDDDLKNKARAELPNVMKNLRLLGETANSANDQEVLLNATKFVQALEGDYKSDALHSISTIWTRIASDKQIDWKDAIYLSEAFHDKELALKSLVKND